MNLSMDHSIYINEALSPLRRRLFSEARIVRKEKGYQFLSGRNEKIFLQIEETVPVIQVACLADVVDSVVLINQNKIIIPILNIGCIALFFSSYCKIA